MKYFQIEPSNIHGVWGDFLVRRHSLLKQYTCTYMTIKEKTR